MSYNSRTKKKLTVLFSFYNEQDTINYTYNKITSIFKKNSIIKNYELIFVDDNSTDNSLKLLKKIRRKDKKVKIITFSRRFGHMEGIMAGLRNSTGDALVYLDIDLQDPPELIPKMFKYFLEEKYDVVFTTRTSRAGESLFKRALSSVGYYFLKKNH